ncbi:MAG TPA: nitrilase family protein, partial [Bacteroidales bacterium]|nr:nitrilase family protein [Bacteroidales bacterium]
MENLKISLIQSDLVWENPTLNRQYFEQKIAQIGETDLIVLPEMFTTGFTMNAARFAEKSDGETFTWLQKMALAKNAAITGSFIVEEQGKFYNRMFWVNPNGSFTKYDKHHTFTLAGEDKTYSAGKQQVVLEYKHWK